MARRTKAEESYEIFHEAAPKGWRKIHVPDIPKKAWKLGKLVALVYEPEEPSKKARTQYQHEFLDNGRASMFWDKEYPMLYSDESGKNLLIVRGKSKYYIDEQRGIIG